MSLAQSIPPIHLSSGRTIGNGRTFIIAEVGSNHCRNLNTAFEHIEAAAATGADAVKFQSINLDELYHQPSEETQALHQQIDLPEEWHGPLKECCQKNGVTFLSTPTYLRAVDVLESVETEIYKLASAQIGVFPQLVQRVAALGKPVILSTGLVVESELDRVIDIFRKAGNSKFVILHCNSVYPAPPEIVHLPRMLEYQRRFHCQVGFSDHTQSNTAAISAVAMGACVIERHFTLDRRLNSPDAPLSLEPSEFTTFVNAVREAELICSPSPRDTLENDESSFKCRIKHHLLTTQNVESGQGLTPDNTILKRGNSGTGIDAWSFITRSTPLIAKKNIREGSWIQNEDI